MGGLDVRMYASLYPADVVGMVLVDSTHPDMAEQLPYLKPGLAAWKAQLERQLRYMPFGIPRLLGWCGNGPSEIRAKLRTIECNRERLRETLAECDSIWTQSAVQVRSTGTLGTMPLVVVSEDPAKNDRKSLAVFEADQQDLAGLSSNSMRVVAFGSGHQIQRDRPDITVGAIRAVFDRGRAVKRANIGG